MADLKTNYKDDVLVSGQQRKYNMIQNSDGTVSFVDVSSYAQYGDVLTADDFNQTNAAVNAVNGKMIDGRISFKWEQNESDQLWYTDIYVDDTKVAAIPFGFNGKT